MTQRRKQQVTKTKTKPVARQNNPVDVPLQQSLISSAVIGLAVLSLCVVFDWSLNVALVAFAFSLMVIWFWRMRLFDGLLFAVEHITQTDIDHDGSIGKPSHLTVVNGGRARAKTAQTVQQTDNANRLKALNTFVHVCYQLGTSESAQGVKPNQRAEYLEHRDTLMRLGVAQWRSSNPKAGWKMVVDEPTALQVIAEHVTEV